LAGSSGGSAQSVGGAVAMVCSGSIRAAVTVGPTPKEFEEAKSRILSGLADPSPDNSKVGGRGFGV
jgi:hypothetical protein